MNSIPPPFKFKGDKNKSKSLKSYGLQLYNSLLSQTNKEGLNYNHKTKILSDGSVISIVLRKNSNYDNWSGSINILTDSVGISPEEGTDLYLESGYIDLITSASCSEYTARPGILNYSTVTSNYIDNTVTPLQGKVSVILDTSLDEYPFTGEVIIDGSESKSIGCSTKLSEVIDSCGNKYTVSENEVDLLGFCTYDKILKKKQAIASVPSSMFSGKLRLMIQSIYGSKRSDYERLEVSEVVVPGFLKLNNFNISALYSPSHGLYTTPDYKYYLIEITDHVRYYPIILTASGEQLAKILSTHPRKDELDFSKKVEAYILSTAKIDKDNVIIGSSIDIFNGTPLYYGWHWNWNGSQADVVLHAEDNINLWYNTSHCRIEISFIDGIFSEELTIVSSGHWWPTPLGLNVFYPAPSINKQAVVLPVIIDQDGNTVPSRAATGSYTSTTIHLYRSMSDELVTCTYAHDLFLDYTHSDTQLLEWCLGETTITRDVIFKNGLQGSNSLNISGNSLIKSLNGTCESTADALKITYVVDSIGSFLYAFSYDGDGSLTRLNKLTCSGTTIKQWLLSTGYFKANAYWQVEPYNYDHKIAFYKVVIHTEAEQSSSGLDSNTAVFLQIPYLDCSTVIVGNRALNSKVGYKQGSNNPFDTSIEAYVGVSLASGASVVAPVPLYGNGGASWGAGPIVYDTTDPSTITDYADLIIYDGSTDTYINLSSGSSLSEYFDILYFLYGFVDHLDFVKEDTSGGYRFSFKDLPIDTTKYPGDGAIGWV